MIALRALLGLHVDIPILAVSNTELNKVNTSPKRNGSCHSPRYRNRLGLTSSYRTATPVVA